MTAVYGVFDNDLDCVAVDGKDSLLEAFELASELIEGGGDIIWIRYPCHWNRGHSGYTVIDDEKVREIIIDAVDYNG